MFAALVSLACSPGAEPTSEISLEAIESPVIFRGDETTAYRDPAVLYHDGIFHLFFTWVRMDADGNHYWVVAKSRSHDLVHWSDPKALTPKDRNLNFASPGNVIRYEGEWLFCAQTYPTPSGEKHGNEDCRVWILPSTDLENWGDPRLLRVKGPDTPAAEMGRLIDPFLIEDKDETGKWWCLFDDNAANMSFSYDLETWDYVGRVEAGENVCVLIDGDDYLMFHSPENGIGMKRSPDMKNWRDLGELITLGQRQWDWARGRITAGYVMDLRADPRVGKYLIFFHGSGPEDERTMFSTHASLGLAWSEDLESWSWPGK